MDTKILGFAGKMQSGKDSCCNLLYCIALRNVLKMTPHAELNDEGRVVVEYADGNRGWFNVDSREPEMMGYMGEFVWPFMRKFSFAELLKEFCQYILGVPEESIWGTNEQKNQQTHLLWENMPVPLYENMNGERFYSNNISEKQKKSLAQVCGPMSGRQVMEYFGTQIARKMYPNVWADSLVRRIEMSKPKYATVCDVRFPNEVEAIKNAGGKMIRLTLVTEEAAANKHISNTALDADVYDWNNFDFVLDNAKMTMTESHAVLLDKLVEWGYMELVELENAS